MTIRSERGPAGASAAAVLALVGTLALLYMVGQFLRNSILVLHELMILNMRA